MNYEEMSDFEISRLTARALGLGFRLRTVRGDDKKVRLGNGLVKDYCNNPSDAWPVILENRIGVNPYQGVRCLWSATKKTEHEAVHVTMQNPLRAAMICFLKMKNSE